MSQIPVCSSIENLPPVEVSNLLSFLENHASAWIFFEDGRRQMSAEFLTDPCVEGIAGVMLFPPEEEVTRLYADVCDALQQNQRVMVLYVDGLSYAQCSRQKERMPGLTSAWDIDKAATVYPPLTNAAMASMLTGVWPCEHGVHSHRHHRLLRPTFLKTALSLGKKVAYVEGDTVILRTEVFPQLNPAAEPSCTDKVVFDSAMEAALEQPDLLLIHFHGLDDLAHEGQAEKYQEKFQELDGYIQCLCEAFAGQAILVSDHGSHAEGKTRSHGVFDCEDLIVPYGRWRGKGDALC